MGLIDLATVTVVYLALLYAANWSWQVEFGRQAFLLFTLYAFGVRIRHVVGAITWFLDLAASLLEFAAGVIP